MLVGGLLTHLPVWGVFLATVGVILLSVDIGFRLGRYQRPRSEQEKKPPVGEMVAATLGLLAFLLAFTFGMGATRYEFRRSLVVEEANAIGTTYLRAGLLPEPHRSAVRNLLRDYVNVRVWDSQSTIDQKIARAEQLHPLLWSHATAAGEKNPGLMVGLFIQSLNGVIELHTKRVMFGLRNPIPEIIWDALYFIAMLSMATLGYHVGLTSTSRSLAVLALIFTFSAVMMLITDLDRPREGFLQVSQQPIVDLRKTMNAQSP